MVIIGAGECGARAALALREHGWTGAITLVGAEDLAPYERPPLSKAVLTGGDGPTYAATAADAELVLGAAATGIDRDAHEVTLADGRRLRYERLLLATGATARRLPVPGAGSVHYLRRFADAAALRDAIGPGTRVGVVGGGFIGLELAASATARAATVTVIETAPGVLGRVVPERIAGRIAQRHREAGVDLRCATGVAEVTGEGIALTSGETVACDVVVAGIGAVPDTELAEKAGLAVDDGVRVDERLTTSDPDVFAAGDCCSFPHPRYGRLRLESWRNAIDQGAFAARAMLGAAEPFAAVPWFWSDQHDLGLQIAGLPGAAATSVTRVRPDGVEIEFGLGADGRLLSAAAVGPGNSVAKDIRLAEKLIARGWSPGPGDLADPMRPLKTFLR